MSVHTVRTQRFSLNEVSVSGLDKQGEPTP